MVMVVMMVVMPGLGRHTHTWVVVFFWHGFFFDSALYFSLYLNKIKVLCKIAILSKPFSE